MHSTDVWKNANWPDYLPPGFGYYYIRGENHVYRAFFANISLIFRKTEFALFQERSSYSADSLEVFAWSLSKYCKHYDVKLYMEGLVATVR